MFWKDDIVLLIIFMSFETVRKQRLLNFVSLHTIKSFEAIQNKLIKSTKIYIRLILIPERWILYISKMSILCCIWIGKCSYNTFDKGKIISSMQHIHDIKKVSANIFLIATIKRSIKFLFAIKFLVYFDYAIDLCPYFFKWTSKLCRFLI